jgi:hypothetical protein
MGEPVTKVWEVTQNESADRSYLQLLWLGSGDWLKVGRLVAALLGLVEYEKPT